MARIFVLYTGGTFGGVQTSRGISPLPVAELAGLLPSVAADVCIEGFERILDSSGIEPADWVDIAQVVAKNYEQFDGFVILHGTDTMAYTSSALSHLFEGLAKPVVLTGSQVPLSFPQNDAEQNYRDAVRFAGSGPPGVWVVFGGLEIRGDRAVKVSCERWQAFSAPKGDSDRGVDPRPFRALSRIEPDVRLLFCHPGLTAAKLAEEILRPAKGLVIASYGVGNLPDDPIVEQALATAISEHGKRIVQVTQCAHGAVDAGVYAAGGSMVRTGVQAGGNLTIEAAITGLMVDLARV